MRMLFTTEETLRRADELVDYLRGPRLWLPASDYPDYDAWLERAHAALKREAKRAVLAIAGSVVVGAVVYQRHREDTSALEVKNITVRADQRGRRIASFLLRSAEIEGLADFGCRRVVCDAKVGNLAVRAFLRASGYVPADVRDLYALGAGADVVYEKTATGRFP